MPWWLWCFQYCLCSSEARNPKLHTGTSSKYSQKQASKAGLISPLLLEGALASPHLLPCIEPYIYPTSPLHLLWLNFTCNVGSSIFAGFVFWQLCTLIKLWQGQWAIRLAQLLLVKPHLLLQPAPALQNLDSCSHSPQNREVLSGRWLHDADSFLWPLLLPCWFYTRQGLIYLLIPKEMNWSHATISSYYCWLKKPPKSTFCQSCLWPYIKVGIKISHYS